MKPKVPPFLIALKAIAKTLRMTIKIAQAAYDRAVPCFCADLTVNPILVEWNKNVAARLAPFPGIGLGLLEPNGYQNYANWATMRSYHPFPQAPWANTRRGLFELDADYYARSGGIFVPSPHYEKLFFRSPFAPQSLIHRPLGSRKDLNSYYRRVKRSRPCRI